MSKTIHDLKIDMRRTSRLQGGQVIPLAEAIEKIIDQLEARIDALENPKPARKKAQAGGD